MESMEKMSEQLMAAAPFIGTALFGCLLQTLKTGWQGWRNFIVSNLSAAFGAWIVYCLVGDLFSPGWGQAISGMVGYQYDASYNCSENENSEPYESYNFDFFANFIK